MKYWGVRFYVSPTTGGHYTYMLLKRPQEDQSLDVARSIVEAFDQTRDLQPWAENLTKFDLIEYGRDPNDTHPPGRDSLLGLMQPIASYVQSDASVKAFRIEKETRTVRKVVPR